VKNEQAVEAKSEFDAAVEFYVRKGWPPSLAKAAVDPFNYACRVHGVTYYFETCQDAGNGWVTLIPSGAPDSGDVLHHNLTDNQPNRSGPPCPRGIDVRVADIEWCADAPFGS
jgi:hypothetical protein